MIDNVEKRDAGEYTCEAGSEKSAFKIQVTGEWRQILVVFLREFNSNSVYLNLLFNVQSLKVDVMSCMFSAEAQAGFSNKESVQKEVKAPLSQRATLSCEVSDSKTQVKWYKDGKEITSSKAVHMESKGKIRELVIEKMDKKDAGEYRCEAGSEKLSFKLQTTGKEIF